MGGQKFDTPHPEGYLFGENMDLNFLGNRPVQVSKPNYICGALWVLWMSWCYTISFVIVLVSLCHPCSSRACEDPEEPSEHQERFFTAC